MAIVFGPIVLRKLDFGSARAPMAVETVTDFPDAFRRLESLGYRHEKDSTAMGQEFVVFKRTEPDCEYVADISKWYGDNRIKEFSFSSFTDEPGWVSDDSKIDFWDRMKHDMYALINAREDYRRAVSDLQPVAEEDGFPVRRHEGRATTSEGWKILIIEDVAQNRPQYKDPPKFWARVGLIWVTDLSLQENMPSSAAREFERELEEVKKKRDSE